MDFKISDLMKGPWYVMLSGLGAILVMAALVAPVQMDRTGILLTGAALVAFGFGRAECMTTQTRLSDGGNLPAGFGPTVLSRPVHVVTATGFWLYAASAVLVVAALVRFWLA